VIVELALSERVDFFLVAGDAFENANRTLRGQLRFRDGLAKLAVAGIPSFVVTGNHDPESGWGPSVAWPDLACRFPSDRVSSQPVLRGGEEIARVYGIGYGVRDVKANLAARFHREKGVPFAVGLLHANVGGDTSAGNYAPCSLADLQAADMDYWALGHIHRHRVVSAHHPTAVYCGNPQGRDPGETEPRGCYLVTVDDGGEIHPEFRPTDVVRWQLLDVPIDGLTDDESLVDRVITTVDQARSSAGRSIVARVRITGRGPLHASLLRSGVLADLRTEALERLGEALPFAWLESVRNETRMDLDLEERRLADDFLGSVLRRFSVARSALKAAGSADGTITDEATDEDGAAVRQELDNVLDELFANVRARPYLRERRPAGAELVNALDAAEALVADRLAGES
jgi:DNA repair exonuclease SbcCD nuclease subunit